MVGDVNWCKNQCILDIKELDMREGTQGLVGDKMERRGDLRRELERLVEIEEIAWCQKSRVMWLKDGDKCTQFFMRSIIPTGPNKFFFSFYNACWEVVQPDIMDVFTYFFQRGRFLRSSNATFIVLLPKKFGASNIKDFIPSA